MLFKTIYWGFGITVSTPVSFVLVPKSRLTEQ
jgi:hypothetical protein